MTAGILLAPSLPRRPSGRLRIPLTPLADAMFQILIFFLLVSDFTPYSSLLLQGGAAETGPSGGVRGSGPASDAMLWTVEPGGLRVTGQFFPSGDIPDLVAALPQNSRLVLILRDAAAVSDVATVLESLADSGVADVRIATGAR